MEKNKNILLIDDEESTLRAFENVLLLNGIDCFATSDISKGIEEFVNREFDFVLLDYQMPGKNGIELMEELLRLKTFAKIIIYTGFTDLSLKQKAIMKGAYEFLYKPLDFIKLINIFNLADKYNLELSTI